MALHASVGCKGPAKGCVCKFFRSVNLTPADFPERQIRCRFQEERFPYWRLPGFCTASIRSIFNSMPHKGGVSEVLARSCARAAVVRSALAARICRLNSCIASTAPGDSFSIRFSKRFAAFSRFATHHVKNRHIAY